MAIINMPIYRRLFDFLCLASIAISVAKTERERRWSPKHARPSEQFLDTISKAGAKFKSLTDAWVATCREVPKAHERSGGTGAKVQRPLPDAEIDAGRVDEEVAHPHP